MAYIPKGALVEVGENVTLLDGTANRSLYVDGSGDVQEQAWGTSGQVYTANGSSSVPTWQDAAGGGMLKTASGGYFLIPAGPAAGTTVTSSTSANTYGSWTQMTASTSAAIFIVGFHIRQQISTQYCQLDIGTGSAASETSVGETKTGAPGATTQFSHTAYFPAPIPVATATRIACRTADEDASARDHDITLICINQADLEAI